MKKDDEPPSGFCGFFLSFSFFLSVLNHLRLLKGGFARMEDENQE
jgi:hypothetical protein